MLNKKSSTDPQCKDATRGIYISGCTLSDETVEMAMLLQYSCQVFFCIQAVLLVGWRTVSGYTTVIHSRKKRDKVEQPLYSTEVFCVRSVYVIITRRATTLCLKLFALCVNSCFTVYGQWIP